MAVWEGPLRGESYAQLSPRCGPCARPETTKKTYARLIPGRQPCFPRVIPDFIPKQESMWTTRWKSSGLRPKTGLSNLNQRKVIHEQEPESVTKRTHRITAVTQWQLDGAGARLGRSAPWPGVSRRPVRAVRVSCNGRVRDAKPGGSASETRASNRPRNINCLDSLQNVRQRMLRIRQRRSISLAPFNDWITTTREMPRLRSA